MDDPEDGGGGKSPFERIAELESALRRVAHNFDLMMHGKPVRDIAEMKAEVAFALRATLSDNGGV